MNKQQEAMLAALEELRKTTSILLSALNSFDRDKAHEAITIMLMQGMDFFGPKSTAMQQFFPVWDAIKVSRRQIRSHTRCRTDRDMGNPTR